MVTAKLLVSAGTFGSNNKVLENEKINGDLEHMDMDHAGGSDSTAGLTSGGQGGGAGGDGKLSKGFRAISW